VFIGAFTHPYQHRKLEFIANNQDVDLTYIVPERAGLERGLYPSENGRRQFEVLPLKSYQLGKPDDPHRFFYKTLDLGLRGRFPDIIHCDVEQESLLAAECVLYGKLYAPKSPLILFAWQNILRKRGFLVKLISNFVLRGTKYICCGNLEAIDILKLQSFKGKASVIPCVGLDTRYFFIQDEKKKRLTRNMLGLNDEIIIGHFGRRVPEKGIETVIKAFALIAQSAPNVKLLIAGEGTQTDDLKSLASKLGVIDHCLFLPPINYEDVVDYVNICDMQVIASRTMPFWKEQLGRVILDGMGCGVPVIGSSSGAIPEVIGNPALIFAEGDETSLAQILTNLIRNPDKRRSLGVDGYKRVIENYTCEKLAERTLLLWQELIKNEI